MDARNKILQFKKVKTEIVKMEEWDDLEVHIQGLTGRQLDSIMSSAKKDQADTDTMFNLIILCSMDEKGNKIFKDDDLEVLKDMPLGPVQKLGTKCLEINGFTSVADKKKN